MDTVLLSTAYFPPIQYMCKFLQYAHVKIECMENYEKQSYRNRLGIVSANGKQDLSVPILHSNRKIRMKDVQISYAENWQKNHFNGLETAYNSSPFYVYYIHEFKFVFFEKEKYLLEMNRKILFKLFDLLNITASYSFTEHFVQHPTCMDDCRTTIHPKVQKMIVDDSIKYLPYYQVFDNKFGFIPNMSILDLLFNIGIDSRSYLLSCIRD